MTLLFITLCLILMVYTIKEARSIWKAESKFAGAFVGLIAAAFPVLLYWLMKH